MKTNDITFIRRMTVAFIICLVLSGITAFPLVTETGFMMRHLSSFPKALQPWIEHVYTSVRHTPGIVLYGTDWLAFAHIVIALFFIGVYLDPVRYKFIVQVGIVACVGVLPLAFICGPVRGIPFLHQLIDCSFGIIGLLPLGILYHRIRRLEQSSLHTQA